MRKILFPAHTMRRRMQLCRKITKTAISSGCREGVRVAAPQQTGSGAREQEKMSEGISLPPNERDYGTACSMQGTDRETNEWCKEHET